MKSNNVYGALRKAKGEIKRKYRGTRLTKHTKNDIINIILKHLNGCSYRLNANMCEPLISQAFIGNNTNIIKFSTCTKDVEYAFNIRVYEVNKTFYVHGIEYELYSIKRRIPTPKEALFNLDSVVKSMDLDNNDFANAMFILRESILTHGS